jgi:hypothetical protein
MDGAAGQGHLDVVKWLHENRKEGCTGNAMNAAAGGDHFEVVKWLFLNRKEGDIENALCKARRQNNKSEPVMFLRALFNSRDQW